MDKNYVVPGGMKLLLEQYMHREGLVLQEVTELLKPYGKTTALPYTVYRDCLEQIGRTDNKPFLGFEIGLNWDWDLMPLFAHVVAPCQSIGEVWARYARFEALLYNVNTVKLHDWGDLAFGEFIMSDGLEATSLIEQVYVACSVAMTRKLIGIPDFVPNQIRLMQSEPAGNLSHSACPIQCDIQFDCSSTGYSIPKAGLGFPINIQAPRLVEIRNKQAATLELNDESSIVGQVERQILERIVYGEPSAEQVADSLSTSRRTLTRQLGTEATSFKEILNNLRRRLASLYITEELSLTEISLLLGYDHQSSFSSAFKRWFGLSPRAMRSQGLGARL